MDSRVWPSFKLRHIILKLMVENEALLPTSYNTHLIRRQQIVIIIYLFIFDERFQVTVTHKIIFRTSYFVISFPFKIQRLMKCKAPISKIYQDWFRLFKNITEVIHKIKNWLKIFKTSFCDDIKVIQPFGIITTFLETTDSMRCFAYLLSNMY